MHFLIKGVSSISSRYNLQLDVIAETSEKYKTLKIKIPIDEDFFEIRILDSFQFLASPLETLAKNQNGNLPILKSFFSNEEQFKLLC